MSWASLRLRLSLTAAVSILVALLLSGIFLTFIFERHVTRRVNAELSVYIKQLAASLYIGEDGQANLIAELADPRFNQPLSGLYWQIEDKTGIVLSSRSLWADEVALPPFDIKNREALRVEGPGPGEDMAIIHAQTIFLETPEGDRAFRLAAAIDKSDIRSARDAFTNDLMIALALLATALLAASTVQVFFGLRPLRQIRDRVTAIRTGSASRLEGEFPSEVQLLVGEVNALLDTNEQAVQRARDSAADLAHGLKTPLAVLQAESRTLADNHQTNSADEISLQVEQMRSRVERHLAHVRMRGAGAVRHIANLRENAEKVVRAMKTMPRGDVIDWRIDAPDELNVPIEAEDLLEVLGNILDNARKWAKREVRISAEQRGETIRIMIADDGPGVPEALRLQVRQRGKRLDEMKTGAGLGLSIAERILEGYNGALAFEAGEDGGAQIEITVPISV